MHRIRNPVPSSCGHAYGEELDSLVESQAIGIWEEETVAARFIHTQTINSHTCARCQLLDADQKAWPLLWAWSLRGRLCHTRGSQTLGPSYGCTHVNNACLPGLHPPFIYPHRASSAPHYPLSCRFRNFFFLHGWMKNQNCWNCIWRKETVGNTLQAAERGKMLPSKTTSVQELLQKADK